MYIKNIQFNYVLLLKEYQIKILKEQGLTDIVLAVHHMSDKIKNYFGERTNKDLCCLIGTNFWVICWLTKKDTILFQNTF